MTDDIAKSLNLEPLDAVIIEDTPAPKRQAALPTNSEANELENDFDYARGNFYNVIERGTEALEDMLDVAKQSQHPRAYEVVSTIMKTLMDANKDLIEVSSKKNEDKVEEKVSSGPVNNNLFVGSTADLQKMLKDLRDGSD
jgi:hypothetical protein